MAYSRQWPSPRTSTFFLPFFSSKYGLYRFLVPLLQRLVLVSDLNGKSGLLVAFSLSLPSDVLLCVSFCPFLFCNHLYGEERAGCFALFVFLVSRYCCVALLYNVMGLSAVCDCGIS